MKKLLLILLCLPMIGFGQQTYDSNSENSLNQLRNSSDFKTFINYFLLNVYSEKNFDSLLYVSSPRIMDFVNEEIGVERFWNLGVDCGLFSFDEETMEGEIKPSTSDLSFFNNREPVGGFCDPATSPDGIYYKQVSNLPQAWDGAREVSIPPPLILKKLNKKVVHIQSGEWIENKLYFVEIENKWFLLYVYDCDCSA